MRQRQIAEVKAELRKLREEIEGDKYKFVVFERDIYNMQ